MQDYANLLLISIFCRFAVYIFNVLFDLTTQYSTIQMNESIYISDALVTVYSYICPRKPVYYCDKWMMMKIFVNGTVHNLWRPVRAAVASRESAAAAAAAGGVWLHAINEVLSALLPARGVHACLYSLIYSAFAEHIGTGCCMWHNWCAAVIWQLGSEILRLDSCKLASIHLHEVSKYECCSEDCRRGVWYYSRSM